MKCHNSVAALGGLVTLSKCRELRELEICESTSKILAPDLIASVTSMNIQKIIFTESCSIQELHADYDYWRRLDESLCQVVERSGYERRLEVVFHAFNTWHGRPDLEELLPVFRKRGRMKILDGVTDMVVYCSG